MITKKSQLDSFPQENTDSLEVYMRHLARYPVLTRQQEVDLINTVNVNKYKLISLCLHSRDSMQKMVVFFEGLGAAKIRQLYRSAAPLNSTKEELADLRDQTVDLIRQKLAKKTVTRRLKASLQTLNLSLKHLEGFCANLRLIDQAAAQASFNAARQAKNRLVECNLRLVFSRIKPYLNRGINLDDLLQEGNLGLLQAVEKFDISRKVRFSTFVTWWIEFYMGRAIANKSRGVRLPVHLVEEINRMARSTRLLTVKLGRDPTDQELAKELNITEQELENIRKINKNPAYLDEPLAENGYALSSYLEDQNYIDPYEAIQRKELSKKVKSILSQLSPLDEKVIRLRFGIGEPRKTLNEITNFLKINS